MESDIQNLGGGSMFCNLTKYWATVETVFDPITHASTSQLSLMLPGAGCEWAKFSGGCYMCGFAGATHKYSRGMLLPASVFKFMLKGALNAHPEAETLAVYNGGSFTNSDEIPESFPEWLCGLVAESSKIKQVFVESRPEFIDADKIHAMVCTLGAKTLKVGIGLECATDFIRENCVNKGFSLAQYNLALQILKNQGARALTYVFLKPLFLSEAEAIEEAVKTITYAFRHGSNEVALESAFVQKGTMMHRMFEQDQFKPPWLWSIIEVIRRTRHLGFVYIGGFKDEPMPIAIPANCPKCSDRVKDALQRYRETYDMSVLDGLDCDCEAQWTDEICKVYPSLEERISR
jgi:radical SAM enzyme (TIGR01210 family)